MAKKPTTTNSPEGASGTAREAPGAGSGTEGAQASAPLVGVQPAPPNSSPSTDPVTHTGDGTVIDGASGSAGPLRRTFPVISLLVHDGEPYEPGDGVRLTRGEHEALRAAGVIEGGWPED